MKEDIHDMWCDLQQHVLINRSQDPLEPRYFFLEPGLSEGPNAGRNFVPASAMAFLSLQVPSPGSLDTLGEFSIMPQQIVL